MFQLGIIFVDFYPSFILCPMCGNKLNLWNDEFKECRNAAVICGECDSMVSFKEKKTEKEPPK